MHSVYRVSSAKNASYVFFSVDSLCALCINGLMSNTITSRLTAYRKKHKLTQAAFGARVGATQSVICRIENGEVRPGLDLAFRIERETGGYLKASAWAPENKRGRK